MQVLNSDIPQCAELNSFKMLVDFMCILIVIYSYISLATNDLPSQYAYADN